MRHPPGVKTLQHLTEMMFEQAPPRLQGGPDQREEVWGLEGETPMFIALLRDEIGEDPVEQTESARVFAENFGEEVGSLPGFTNYYDGGLEDAELSEAQGFVFIGATCVSVGDDEPVLWVDALVTAIPEGIVVIAAFSHLPGEPDDPSLNLAAVGLQDLRSLGTRQFTIGAG